jgi:hypothetical protein
LAAREAVINHINKLDKKKGNKKWRLRQ